MNSVLRSTSRLTMLVLLVTTLPAGAIGAARRDQAATATESKIAAWLEANIPVYMERAGLPGFSIAVVQEGSTIYAEGFGSRDRERNLPATVDTLYGIGSITKSFVAIAILQLAEAGKIELDDPVGEHVPFELGSADNPITIHHLLTHSLGIPSLASSTVAISRGLGLDTGIPFGSAEDFYRFVNAATDEQVAQPGERFFYHNAAWRLLGDIVQRVSGQPFHVYVEKNVIDPLDMPRTGMNLEDFEGDPDHIVPYLRTPAGHQPSQFPYPNPNENPGFSFLSAAGGIFSSVNEMTHYLVAHLEQGQNLENPILGQESFALMQSLQIEEGEGYYGKEGYGYGLSVTPDFFGHQMIGHGGSISVSTAYMAFVPDLDAGVVMMGNSSGMPYATIAESLFAILLGKAPEETLPAIEIRERMNRLVGTYEVYRGLDRLEVVIRRGMLYLESTSRFAPEVTNSTPIIPADPSLETTMFYTMSNGLKSPVEFTTDAEGKISLIRGRYRYHKKD